MIGRTIARYQILEQLGEGGMGQVFKALDPRLDRFIALKLLHHDRIGSEEQIRRFAQEAKAASALNHPNIITIYEIEKIPDGPEYIAMEYVEGQTLRALAGRQLPPEAYYAVCRQVAEALAAAHARGIIHRDIKPENIMLRKDGYVKVLDFGLARLLQDSLKVGRTQTFSTAPNVLIGTPAYMSPEQARGELLSGATDIFSFGLVMYELATGQHPYSAASHLAVLQAILTEAPVPPSRLKPEIPRMLEDLMLRMLAKDPGRRPTAQEILETVGQADVRNLKQSLATAARPQRFTVGHIAEQTELRRGYECAIKGQGIFLCISGEPGIGKTTLVNDFLDEVSGEESCVGRGRCSERLAGAEAYLPILEALEDLIHSADGSQWARILIQCAPTWYVQITSSSQDPADSLRAQTAGASQDRMKREITTFFQEVSRVKPLILFFDDLHWVDVSTLDIISYLADRCGFMRILMLATYRPTDLMLAKHPFLQVRLELQIRGACREIPVGFLALPEIEKYLAHSFPGHRFPAEFGHLIHSRTEGNPLFMVDLLRYLRDRGVLTPDPGGVGWSLAQSLSDIAGGIPESARSMIQRKIDRLDEEDRKLLTCASIQGYEFDSAVMSESLGMDAADLEERLELLERVHEFVRQQKEVRFPDGSFSLRYQFVHVLYQNSFYESIRPTRRAALSGTVARTLLRLHGDKNAAVATELALLFEAAREPARAMEFFTLASQQAARRSANREAAALAKRGLDLLPNLTDETERLRHELPLLLSFAAPFMQLKGYTHPEVLKSYNRALALCRETPDSFETFTILTGIGAYSLFRPNLSTAHEVLDRMMRLSEQSPHPGTQAWVNFVAASVYSHSGELERARRHIDRVSAAYDPALHNSYILMTGLDPGVAGRGQESRISWLIGLPDRAGSCARETEAMARKTQHAFTAAISFFFAAMARHYRHETGECLGLARESEAMSLEHELPIVRGWSGVLHGWAIAETGQVEEGIGRIRQALELMRIIGCEVFGPEFKGILAELLARSGRHEEALELLDEILPVAVETGEMFCVSEVLRRKGDILLMHAPDRTTEAETLFRGSLSQAGKYGCLSFELRAATSLARLLAAGGRRNEAGSLLAGVRARFIEGFQTRDLQDATTLLAEIGKVSPAGPIPS